MAKRRLAVVLSADAAGYSRLMSEDEAATIASIGAARVVFRERIGAGDGRVVDTAGDSVLAVFGSVVEALRAAIEIQAELSRRGEGVAEGRRMRFRIGLNAGEIVEQDDGTVYGDGVNVAARLQALADPGGICVSEVVAAEARNKLPVRFESLGEQRVKNIAEPVRAHRVVSAEGEPKPAAEPKPVGAAFPLPAKPSIAILPFTNMSGDAEQEYFSDGITEDLITALSRIRWLFVIARNSTFTYKGKPVDVKQVGRDLGVRYVLEGSVRKGGNRVRITAQLIDATSGAHVWAERFDRELADIFAVQDEITERIAATIEPELARAELERARRKPPESLDAWDLYQRGLWHVWQFNAADNARARELFERAAALDPGFSPFVAALALCRLLDHTLRYRPMSERNAEASLEIARRAVALDDKDPTAHAVVGRAYSALGDHDAAVGELRQAVGLNPSLALAHYGLGVALVLSGKPAEAMAELDAARRLSPHDPYLWSFAMFRAWACLSLGDFERAIEDASLAVRQPRAPFPAWGTLASALGHAGRVEEGKAALAKALELEPQFLTGGFIDEIWPNLDSVFFERFYDGLRAVNPAVADPRTIDRQRKSPREPSGDGRQ
jgi:adenylate cyclase